MPASLGIKSFTKQTHLTQVTKQPPKSPIDVFRAKEHTQKLNWSPMLIHGE